MKNSNLSLTNRWVVVCHDASTLNYFDTVVRKLSKKQAFENVINYILAVLPTIMCNVRLYILNKRTE